MPKGDNADAEKFFKRCLPRFALLLRSICMTILGPITMVMCAVIVGVALAIFAEDPASSDAFRLIGGSGTDARWLVIHP
jgi:hypothetical protein